jgi:hypothetical protein
MISSTSAIASACVADSDGTTAIIALLPPIELFAPGRIRNDHEIVGAWSEAEARTFADDADDGVFQGANPHFLAHRVHALLFEQRFVGTVTEHDEIAAMLHFLLGERSPTDDLREVHLDEELARAEDRNGTGALIAIENAFRCRLPARAEPGVHERNFR